MQRRNVKISLVLLLVLGLIFAFGVLPCFAEETFTITTYYPSPCGVYNELQSNRLAVGDTNGSGGLDAGDQPNRDGDIRLRQQPDDPTDWSAGEIGQFAYSQVDDELYHYNGSQWVTQGGGMGYFLQCGNTCPQGTTRMGPARGGTAINGIIARRGYVEYDASYSGGNCSCDCYCGESLDPGGGAFQLCASQYSCGPSIGTTGSSQEVCEVKCKRICLLRYSTPYTAEISSISVCR